MEVKDIIALANAGFNYQQIMALAGHAQNPVQMPMQNPVQNPAPNPVQMPVPNPVQMPVQNPVPNPVQMPMQNPAQMFMQNPAQMFMQYQNPAQPDIMTALRNLTNAVQNNNIANITQPATRTADDIVASIINPEKEV